jgi:hypothetical protein
MLYSHRANRRTVYLQQLHRWPWQGNMVATTAGDDDAVHGMSGLGDTSQGQQQGLGLTPAVIAAAEAARVRMAYALQEAPASKEAREVDTRREQDRV